MTEATWKLPISISQQKGLDAQSSSVESAAAITRADEEVLAADGSRYLFEALACNMRQCISCVAYSLFKKLLHV